MTDIGFEPALEPKPYRARVCPMCKDRWGRIVGCPGCVEEVDEWPE